MKQTHTYKLLLLLLLLVVNIKAQVDTTKTYMFESIEVKQTRYEAALENVSLTSRKYLLKNTITSSNNSLLSSLSSKVPSLFITERGFAGFGVSNPAGRISIRGINGIQQVLIIVNEVPQYAGLFGHPINDLHTSSTISDVNVISGPSSLMYGSNALGGIIKINTKQSLNSGMNISLNADYGSFNTKIVSGMAGYVFENHSISFGASTSQTDSDRPNSAYRNDEGRFKYTYKLNAIWDVQLSSSVNRIKSHNPGTITNPNLNNSVWTDITRTSTNLSIKNKSETLEGVTNISFSNGVHDVYDGFHSNDYLLGVSILEGISLSKSSILTVGASLQNYGGMARTIKVLADTSVTEVASFATMSYSFNDELNVSGGLRVSNHSSYGFKTIPQIKINYMPIRATNISLGVSKGYRSPTIAELFLFGANKNLQPEDLVSYEIGVKQELIANKLKAGINFYLLNGKNLILMTGRFPNILNVNTGSVNNKGIEVETNVKPFENILMNAVYSYLNTENVIVGAPEQQYSIETVYKYHNYEIGLVIKGVQDLIKLNDPAKSIIKKESYTLLNLFTAYRLFQNLSFTFHLDNILDRQYEIINGYPMPGRSFLAGVKFNIN